MISIYCAGAIDLSTNAAETRWRAELAAKLDAVGLSCVLFDPSTAFKSSCWGKEVNLNRSLYIEQCNNHALDNADIMVCSISSKTPSIGTPIELDRAFNNCKKIIVLTDIKPGTSAYLDNRVHGDDYVYMYDGQLGVADVFDRLVDRIQAYCNELSRSVPLYQSQTTGSDSPTLAPLQKRLD